MNIENSAYGWRADTICHLQDLGIDGKRILVLCTAKSFFGVLQTSVYAVVEKENLGSLVLITDYNKKLAVTHTKCTEENVQEQHARFEKDINIYIEEANQHYAT